MIKTLGVKYLVKIGELNTLEVKRKADFGYFLDGQTGNSTDRIKYA